MKHSLINHESLKEIISVSRISVQPKKIFCCFRPTVHALVIAIVTTLIGGFFDGKKCQLFNFIGRQKNKCRTLIAKIIVPHR